MKVYSCRYVRHGDAGDMVFGYHWRPAYLVLGDGEELDGPSHAWFEDRMFDAVSGKNVGDTRNYCVNMWCCHEDCSPMSLVFED